MKTNDLIAMLSTNTEPVDRKLVIRTVCIALVAGALVAIGSALVGLGLRTDLTTAHALIFLVTKLAFAIGIVGVAAIYLTRLTSPGGELRTPSILAVIPFVVIALLAGTSLGAAPSSHWDKMIVGDQWLECLLSIPIIAIAPFAITIWAVRQAAPTDLVRAGAFAGLIAGGISAMAYALHCTDDSLPFVAVWYGGTIVLCTLAGAVLGPRLLRW
jgi:hypothetical protein